MIYSVTVPQEHARIYHSVEKICSDLKISRATFYSILYLKCKFNSKKTLHLKDVIISTEHEPGDLQQLAIIKREFAEDVKNLKKAIVYNKNKIKEYEGLITSLMDFTVTYLGETKYYNTIKEIALDFKGTKININDDNRKLRMKIAKCNNVIHKYELKLKELEI